MNETPAQYDPNIALFDIRKYAERVSVTAGQDTPVRVALAYEIRKLDRWIRNGGYLPREWDPKISVKDLQEVDVDHQMSHAINGLTRSVNHHADSIASLAFGQNVTRNRLDTLTGQLSGTQTTVGELEECVKGLAMRLDVLTERVNRVEGPNADTGTADAIDFNINQLRTQFNNLAMRLDGIVNSIAKRFPSM